MVGRSARQSVAGAAGLALALGLALTAGAALRSSVLVAYSFDDEQIETGPDTFRVFEHARGTVTLSEAFRMSGYHSVEIRDVAGDGDFPELQGYFPVRREGTLYAHFAFLVTDPSETWNAALAGPAGFTLSRDGIGFWLTTRDGMLLHVSDSIPKKLFRLRPFTWYRVDLAYHVARGTYDLSIAEEQRLEQIVFLQDQPNATRHAGSAIDKFSFVGDVSADRSNVVYYVDDVVIGSDRSVAQLPFVAPGRRKLFFDRDQALKQRMQAGPSCLPAGDVDDFGITPTLGRELLAGGALGPLAAALRGQAPPPEPPPELGPEPRRLLTGLSHWSAGCRQLAGGDGDGALARFERAAELVPEARQYPVSAVLALAAGGRHDEAERRWRRIEPGWRDDARYAVVMALLGLARDDLDAAERWLARPAAEAPERFDGDAAASAQTAARYFYVLLWQDRLHEAERLALAMARRELALDRPTARWWELAGDAAVYLDEPARAVERYEAALQAQPETRSVLLKLSDVHFLLGDLERERRYRERIYGTLRSR